MASSKANKAGGKRKGMVIVTVKGVMIFVIILATLLSVAYVFSGGLGDFVNSLLKSMHLVKKFESDAIAVQSVDALRCASNSVAMGKVSKMSCPEYNAQLYVGKPESTGKVIKNFMTGFVVSKKDKAYYVDEAKMEAKYGQVKVKCWRTSLSEVECYVSGFYLPQAGDKGYKDWILLYHDPQYIVYYEAFPHGEEEAWTAMLQGNNWILFSMMVWGGLVNFGGEMIFRRISFFLPRFAKPTELASAIFKKVKEPFVEATTKLFLRMGEKESVEKGAEEGVKEISEVVIRRAVGKEVSEETITDLVGKREFLDAVMNKDKEEIRNLLITGGIPQKEVPKVTEDLINIVPLVIKEGKQALLDNVKAWMILMQMRSNEEAFNKISSILLKDTSRYIEISQDLGMDPLKEVIKRDLKAFFTKGGATRDLAIRLGADMYNSLSGEDQQKIERIAQTMECSSMVGRGLGSQASALAGCYLMTSIFLEIHLADIENEKYIPVGVNSLGLVSPKWQILNFALAGKKVKEFPLASQTASYMLFLQKHLPSDYSHADIPSTRLYLASPCKADLYVHPSYYTDIKASVYPCESWGWDLRFYYKSSFWNNMEDLNSLAPSSFFSSGSKSNRNTFTLDSDEEAYIKETIDLCYKTKIENKEDAKLLCACIPNSIEWMGDKIIFDSDGVKVNDKYYYKGDRKFVYSEGMCKEWLKDPTLLYVDEKGETRIAKSSELRKRSMNNFKNINPDLFNLLNKREVCYFSGYYFNKVKDAKTNKWTYPKKVDEKTIYKLYTSTPLFKLPLDNSYIVAQLSGVDPYGRGQDLVTLKGNEQGIKIYVNGGKLSDIYTQHDDIVYANNILVTPVNPDTKLEHNFCYYGSPTTTQYIIMYAPGLILDFIASFFSPLAAGAMHIASGSLTVFLEHQIKNQYTWPDNPNLIDNVRSLQDIISKSKKELKVDYGGVNV